MKKLAVAFVLALTLIGATVAVSHYMADSAQVAAEPDGN